MLFSIEYLLTIFIAVFFGITAGYIYGLLFVKKQTGVFLLAYPKWQAYLLDFLRIFIFGCMIGYLLINDLYTSILMMVCFLAIFWIKLLY